MKILFLAPQPFFQERGTPIAVRLALEVLAKRPGTQIDLLAYHEGIHIEIPNVKIHRIKAPSWLRGVGPGISVKKLLCDVIFLFTALRLAWGAREDKYTIVHAVEEAVFVAFIIKMLFKVPYIYDMDSSLAMQLTEKWTLLKPFRTIFEWFEKIVIQSSIAVVPVCDALAVVAENHGSKQVHTLYDFSLLNMESQSEVEVDDLRRTLKVKEGELLALYIGNLEPYQGIDLLLESVKLIVDKLQNTKICIIGGTPQHIADYQQRINNSNLQQHIFLIGSRPVGHLSEYLKQADILLSPRVKGNNTPMKIYSYLHSGKAILATRLPTHTQVLDDSVACLTAPNPSEFGEGFSKLIADQALRTTVANNAYRLAEGKYTFNVFQKKLLDIYQTLSTMIAKAEKHDG